MRLLPALWLAAALPLTAPDAEAAARRARFGVEHALTIASIAEVAWSPDGRRLAFVVHAPDTAENATNADLWMIDGGGPPARLTRLAGADYSPTFSPRGDTLAFVTHRGGEEGRSSIWMMSLAGGEPWPFARLEESVSEVAWSPDGRHLAYVRLDTLPRRVREWRKQRRDPVVAEQRLQYPHLWVVELATGRHRRLTSGERHVWHARWSPDSRAIAFLVSPTGRPDDGLEVDIGIVAAAGGPVRTAGVVGAEYAWSPDGRWIAVAAPAGREAWVAQEHLWLIPAAGGPPLRLAAAFDEDAGTPVWSRGSDTLFFHSSQGVSTVVAAVALPEGLAAAASAAGRPGGRVAAGSSAAATVAATVTLSTDRRAEAGTMVGGSAGGVAWVQSSPGSPAELWIAGHPALPGRAATAFHSEIAALDRGETRVVSWASTDGARIEGLLVRPPGAAARARLPTLVQLHGGPYGSREALGFQPLAQLFAAAGYQVFLPNFRASGGYGVAFKVRRRADWGGQDWDDVATGIDHLVAGGLADPRRLGVYGRSYGGYLAAWGTTRTTRFDAACVTAGAVDLASLYGQSDVWSYRAWDFEGRPWESAERWAARSPITHIDRVRTPTLIQIGEHDARIPLAQALEHHRALRSLGVPVELVHYPREGHVLREPRHRADHMMRMLAWWDRWVR